MLHKLINAVPTAIEKRDVSSKRGRQSPVVLPPPPPPPPPREGPSKGKRDVTLQIEKRDVSSQRGRQSPVVLPPPPPPPPPREGPPKGKRDVTLQELLDAAPTTVVVQTKNGPITIEVQPAKQWIKDKLADKNVQRKIAAMVRQGQQEKKG